MAHAYATAEKAQILWTLGITEHHNGVDNVKSLCNLALLTGHIGRWGSGLVPLRGQNNVQGGGDMGALPNKFPGFQDITNPDHRAKFETAYGMELNPNNGKHLTLMLEAMEHGEIKAAYCIGENPADSEASAGHSRALLEGLDILVVQDIFMTATAQLADVVLPSSVGWAECDGTVTSSERRVQRAPPSPRPVRAVTITRSSASSPSAWVSLVGRPNPAGTVGRAAVAVAAPRRHELRRLEAEGGLQWPCPSEDHPGSPFLHGWLWEDDLGGRAPSPFSITEHEGPKEQLTDEFPLRLTTGRSLDSYNTGVQSGGFESPIRSGDELDMNPGGAADLGIDDGERVLVSSPRGRSRWACASSPTFPPASPSPRSTSRTWSTSTSSPTTNGTVTPAPLSSRPLRFVSRSCVRNG